MSAILALLLCAASGTVYEANLGETGEKAVVGADGAQARALAEAVAREAFNNVAFFAGHPSQIRGAAGGTPTADR